MKSRVAINGCGRIGRLVLRQALLKDHLEIVAVNDLIDLDHLAYLLKYDSIHGQFPRDLSVDGKGLRVDGRLVAFSSYSQPEDLPWKSLGVDIVVEATGRFMERRDLEKHLEAGAKKVILSAPTNSQDVPTVVLGVNEKTLRREDSIISNASCTTNCLAPLAKLLMDRFGIEEALMTTIHAFTSSQTTVDGPSRKDWRGGRSALLNIIPASTGAAQSVALCIPELQGKLTGMAFRVPVADVSCVDLTVRLSTSTSFEEICYLMKEASLGSLKGILGYTEDAVVSSDFIGSTLSSIFDRGAGLALNDRFYKLVAWYDNEMGYAARVVDLIGYISSLS